MVIVRESPQARRSPEADPTQWPPKSPFAALISSPSGRKRWQTSTSHRQERTPSPSPLRKPIAHSKDSPRAHNYSNENLRSDDDEDEDEEMVQLRLAEIQAKLKIKALQRKAKKSGGEPSNETATAGTSVPAVRDDDTKSHNMRSSRAKTAIQIPLSPTRTSDVPKEALSPARRKLGLRDVRKADEVSLKRPRDNIFTSFSNGRRSTTEKNGQSHDSSKPMTFSERLAASRNIAEMADAKQDRIEQARTKAFSGDAKPFAQAQTMIERRVKPDMLGQSVAKRPSSSHALSDSQAKATLSSTAPASLRNKPTEKPKAKQAGSTNQVDAPSCSFDPYSEIHLSKRHVAHSVVAREMENKEIYTLPRLLKEVTSPHYDPPNCESDYVVFAILAAKSSPFDQKATHRTSDEHAPQEDAHGPRNKFMVLTLCDLKWEVDCFLFGTGFDQFWKLTPGTLLAILNPGIMAPKKNSANGRFSLKLGSSEDCVMEIGIARDLGYCDSIKKNGQKCHEWIDKRSTQICEFHLNLLIQQGRKDRMEVNTMFRDAHAGESKYRLQSRVLREREWDDREQNKKKPTNMSTHFEYGRLYTVPATHRGSVANLLDGEDTDALHNMTREEASRKRIAEAQKERDLAKRLGEMGNGMGAEYLRASHPSSAAAAAATKNVAASSSQLVSQALFVKPKVSDLGLLDNKAADIHLSPAKDRRRHFGLGLSTKRTTAGGAGAMGWGGAKKAGLLQPGEVPVASSEKGQTRLDSVIKPKAALVRDRSSDGSLSPKKRARFALEKGIREPGRESLGGDDLKTLTAQSTRQNMDDDDDDLDIV